MVRKVSPDIDTNPSITHLYNASIIKSLLPKDAKILDIGCWSGQLAGALDDTKTSYWGIEPNKKALSLAKKLYPQHHWIVGTIDQILSIKQKFDVVALCDVLEHIPQNTEINSLRSIYQVLKPGGKLLINTPADNFYSKLSDPAFFISNHRHYSFNQLSLFLKDSGFTINQAWRSGGFYFSFRYLLSLLVKYFPLLSMFSFVVNLLEKAAQKELWEKRGYLSYYIIATKNDKNN